MHDIRTPDIDIVDSAPLLPTLRPEKIAIFRALQLGDMLCAVPALRALRAALPGTRITLIGLPWATWFAARFRRYLDDFIPFPVHPSLPEQAVQEQQLPAFYERMRARGFDLALQMHGSGETSNPVVRDFGARAIAGFAPASDDSLDSRHFLPYPGDGAEPLRLLRLAAHLGAAPQGAALEFPLTDTDRDELDATPLTREISSDGYFCIHPGARNRSKCWPVERFAEVADALAQRYHLQPVLTGSPQETDLTAAVAAHMRTPALATAGPLSIGAMAALMAGARLLVSNDTGVSHIAAGLRLPSVVIFNNADMQRWAPLDRHRHRCIRDPEGERASLVLAHACDLLDAESESGASRR